MSKQTFGVIITTRDFFPSHLVAKARSAITKKLEELGYGMVCVSEQDTKFGAVVTYEEAKTCANLFKRHASEISGIIVILPNFGEETGVAEAIQLSGLNVPVLVQACDDKLDTLGLENRRDAFCGKISVCNNLKQRGIKYTLTKTHTCDIDSENFALDIRNFAAVCRVVVGLRGLRIAAIGTRPNAFNTVRFSEKILQRAGITVCTIGMAEVMDAAKKLSDGDPEVIAKAKEIRAYGKIPESIGANKVLLQAKLCLALERMVDRFECGASAIECWDAVQNQYGCATCLSMSMMGEKGKPSACEMDVTGALTMKALGLASGIPAAYMDWNNNADDDRNRCINLHCSNFPKSFFAKPEIEISNLDVLATTINEDLCFGACKGQVAEGPMTFAKITTDDTDGKLKMYVGSGRFLKDEIRTKGGVALCGIDRLQDLMKHVCRNGYEHHVAMSRGHIASVLEEAFSNYLEIEVYNHDAE